MLPPGCGVWELFFVVVFGFCGHRRCVESRRSWDSRLGLDREVVGVLWMTTTDGCEKSPSRCKTILHSTRHTVSIYSGLNVYLKT